MGWCSATVIFDQIAEVVLNDKPINKRAVLKTVIRALEDGDWDCQSDSAYREHPLVRELMQEIHPHWFEDDK